MVKNREAEPIIKENPWMRIVRTRDDLSSARNYLGDAIGELMASEEIPVTEEQAHKKRVEVERHIREAERNIARAKRRINFEEDGIDVS